jgi:preprotein translocase subunit SecG
VIYVLYFLHVLVCIFLILVVLIQQGKGADLSVFGGGATMAAFGARGATTLLHKLTVAAFITFILTTLSIAVIDGRSGGTSVMSGTPAPASAPATAPASAPATPAPAQPAQPQGQSPAPAEKPQGR